MVEERKEIWVAQLGDMVWLFEDEEDAREFERRSRSSTGTVMSVARRKVHPAGSVCQGKPGESSCG